MSKKVRDIEDTWMTQIKFLDMKTTMYEIIIYTECN